MKEFTSNGLTIGSKEYFDSAPTVWKIEEDLDLGANGNYYMSIDNIMRFRQEIAADRAGTQVAYLTTYLDSIERRSDAYFDSIEGRPAIGRIRQPGSPQIRSRLEGLDELEDVLRPLPEFLGNAILKIVANTRNEAASKKQQQLMSNQNLNLGEFLGDNTGNPSEIQRISVFLKNFSDVPGMDMATVREFFRHMDEHPNIRLDFSSTLTPRDIRRGAINNYLAAADEAIKEMFPDLTSEEARFLYWSYVWATNSGLTYAEGSSRLAFGRLSVGAIMGLAASTANKAFTTGAPALTKGPQLPNAPINPRAYVPQGISQVSFNRAVRLIRERTGHISNDIVVQGSRAGGTARPTSDIDFGIRVPPQKFDQLIRERFGTPNPGSSAERTMLKAIERGRIHAGEAGFKRLKEELHIL